MTSHEEAPPGVVAQSVDGNIQDGRLQRLYAYWTEKRGARPMPSRRDIDPLDFPYVLGNVMLMDVLREPERFRVRLHGSNVATRMHYDMTGKLLDEVPAPGWRKYIIERCRGLVATGKPLLLSNDLFLDGWGSRYEALWLPFSDDGAAVDMLMCALIFSELTPAPP